MVKFITYLSAVSEVILTRKAAVRTHGVPIHCKNMMVILTQNVVTSVACVVTPSC